MKDRLSKKAALARLLSAVRAADDEVGFTFGLVRPPKPGEKLNSRAGGGGVRYEAAAMERPLWEAVRAALAEYDAAK